MLCHWERRSSRQNSTTNQNLMTKPNMLVIDNSFRTCYTRRLSLATLFRRRLAIMVVIFVRSCVTTAKCHCVESRRKHTRKITAVESRGNLSPNGGSSQTGKLFTLRSARPNEPLGGAHRVAMPGHGTPATVCTAERCCCVGCVGGVARSLWESNGC